MFAESILRRKIMSSRRLLKVITGLYFGILALNAAFLVLAWDGTRTIQLAQPKAQQAQNFSQTYAQEIYRHYFPGRSQVRDFLLSEFIGVSYYTGAFLWAPLMQIPLAMTLGVVMASRWRWLAVGVGLTLAGALLIYLPILNHIAHMTD